MQTVILMGLVFLMAAQVHATTKTFYLKHDGLTRKYAINLPKSYSGKTPVPLVVYIHGGGGNAQSAFDDGMGDSSESLGFILAAPEAMNGAWNGGTWDSGTCCGINDDTGFIREMLKQIERNYKIDTRRIYATGISNGGLMTNRIACELSTQIAAIATVAPAAVPMPCTPVRAVPVLDIHGEMDRCNPFYGGIPPFSTCAEQPYTRMSALDTQSFWKEMYNCSADTVSFFQNSNVSCVQYTHCTEGAFAFCDVKNMGHTWPSGKQYFPASWIGPVSYDIAFTQMWKFLVQYRLP